ncbi:MAG: NAD(P)-binding domain-containing protein, partial [Planctomycetes bacterium]|nr:NAD(P)-binding domain-containing protein [Planctomycetota bacterium]
MSANYDIAVIGTGTWGCATAIVLARKSPTRKIILWGRDAQKCAAMHKQRLHPLMADISLPENLFISNDPLVIKSCTLVFWAVPTQHTRAQAEIIQGFLHPDAALVSLSKGLEQQTLLTVTKILASV